MGWNLQKRIVLDTALELSRKGLVIGTMGNVSIRLPVLRGKHVMAITPSNRYYDSLTAEDIVITDLDGHVVEGSLKPSTETMVHAAVYKKRRSINAVIHYHSVYSSAFAVTRRDIPRILDDQVVCLGGEIKVAGYALAGTDALVTNVVKALGQRNAVIMANSGALVVGRTMKNAFTNAQLLEKTAQAYLYSQGLGKIEKLPAVALKAEKHIFRQLYG
jgi:L-fuculose-phosphate aldolase